MTASIAPRQAATAGAAGSLAPGVALPAGGPSLATSLRRRLLGISPDEVRVERRGFVVGDARVRDRLERIGLAFLSGYHAALEFDDERALAARLAAEERELSGFAFEGAAMALTLLDAFTPWARGRWARLARGAGAAHLYMVHVGAGWALARLPRGFAWARPAADPLLRWLVWDGFGFHEGYFHRARRVASQERPRGTRGYSLRAFDQGLGRSLWFGEGADPDRIARTIAAFDRDRRGDLWSGVGLAAAYAGGVNRAALDSLPALAGAQRAHLAQGAAFAAKARERAGNPAPHTALACEALCGMPAEAAARLTDDALVDLPAVDGRADRAGEEPAFERWRARVRARFEPAGGRAPSAAGSA
jgi:hypothetical protein